MARVCVLDLTRSLLYSQTSSDSASRGLIVNPDAFISVTSSIHQEFPEMSTLTYINSYTNHSSIKPPSIQLPSLEDFDRGVDAIARSHESERAWSFSSFVPNLTPKPLSSTVVLSIHEPNHLKPAIISDFCSSRIEGYPSPPSDRKKQYANQKGKHINQKYTTEQGDFIIYLWHDRKLNWQDIQNRFESEFGHSPKRTVPGLQSQYYRMNDRIPLWDDDGWLVFGNEDDVEPIYISIKCRERETQRRPIESLGLGQRYPERAIGYSWVDAETKRKCHDLAIKRTLQLRERAEQRESKERRKK
ncbi:hypothetical protein GGI35DRAFT_472886 [Trichoderma velutinum]